MTLIKLIEKIQEEAKRQAAEQEALLARLRQEVQNDRERLDTRLNQIDDTEVIKAWVTKRIEEAKVEMEEKAQAASQGVKVKLNRIFSENLQVPELIGSKASGCRYQNLREWILAKVQEDRAASRRVEAAVAGSLAEKIT